MRTRIALLILALLPILLITDLFFGKGSSHSIEIEERVTTPPAPPAPPVPLAQNGVVIDERFDVRPGGELQVLVPDANVILETGPSDEAHIQVVLDARDMDRAREYAKSLQLRVEKNGQTVSVLAEPRRHRRHHGHRSGRMRLMVRASIPAVFDTDIRTSDGDIVAGELEGTVSLKTSDGSIRAERLQGPEVNLRTSDGDLSVESIDSPSVTLQSSDGSIALGSVTSTRVRIRTSDGDIAIDELSGDSDVVTSDGAIVVGTARGEQVRFRSSDGEILVRELVTPQGELRTSEGSLMLEHVEGSFNAITSSGDIRVQLAKPGDLYLRTSDGDIAITAPASLPAVLRLSGEHVRVSSDFNFQGRMETERAEGEINGGGQTIEARTSDGQVILQTD